MYGLVNNGIRDLVLETAGEDAWDEIRNQAGCPERDFISMQNYPDGLTYNLVAAASEHLNVPAQDLLQSFGKHWITFTGDQGYGPLLTMAGDDLAGFLSNLDAMHSRISLSFPDLDPPSFQAEEEPDGSILLRYYSNREGLAPMVLGLLQGVASRFDGSIEIQHSAKRADSGHDEFVITRISAAGNGTNAA